MDHHLSGPLWGNLLIIVGGGAITLACFAAMVWMLLRPGETDPHHPKHHILDNECRNEPS